MTDGAEQVEQSLARLDELSKLHLTLGREMTEAYGGSLYGMDLLAYGALNRSRAHIAGFTQLIRAENLLCAEAILRLQLDTALRFSAAWLVESPHEFALEVLRGAQIRGLVDRSGKRMTDAYLVSCLAQEYPWVSKVYERTSGYVHFSSVHVLAAVTLKDEAEQRGRFEVKVSDVDKPLPQAIYTEAIDAFAASTEILLHYVHGWTLTKANPEAVSRVKRTSDPLPRADT